MKININFLLLFCLLFFVSSCSKDNLDTPTSYLQGKIMYNGESLNLRGTGQAVQLQLYQDGWQKHDPIPVYVGQDGSFSANLFNGDYKLVTRDKNGPWVNTRDTLRITLKGHENVELNVTPYFLISDEQITLSNFTLSVNCTIHKIVQEAKINKVICILSTTQFADDVNNIYNSIIEQPTEDKVTFTTNLDTNKDIVEAKSLFARIGVQAESADQAIYSKVIRLK